MKKDKLKNDNPLRSKRASARTITDTNGEMAEIKGVERDVTGTSEISEASGSSESRYRREYEESRKAEKWARNMLDFVPYPMVFYSTEGKVAYVNPAFTNLFGWTLDELAGRTIPYVPPDLQQEADDNIKKFLKAKSTHYETRRLTKDGRLLDVDIRGGIYSDEDKTISGLIIIRDITQEKKLKLINETLLRISLALPAYPVLEDLLDYISGEIKDLLGTEASLVMLMDEKKEEIFFQGAAHDDSKAKSRIKKVRFPAKASVTGKVIRSGQPVIVHDTSREPDFYPGVDEQLDVQTRNMLIVPIRSTDRIIGVLNAVNKKEGSFDNTDLELLSMIAGSVALSIENARFSNELREAYHEVTSLNRAKDKVINHLSHELKTPVSVLLSTLNILTKKLKPLPVESWSPTLKRARRNLERILEVQYEVEDIMRDRDYRPYNLLLFLLQECADEIEALTAEEMGEGVIVRRIENRIKEIFGTKENEISEIELGPYTLKILANLKQHFSHRHIDIVEHIGKSPLIRIPLDVLEKVFIGLIRNSIENSPDNGKIELIVKKRGKGAELIVRDYGVGITEESGRRIFEGFFTTRETIDYSSKRSFDFNAGGKGADLLRMKIFSERYNFKIDMESTRCPHIPKESDICPGEITRCRFCEEIEDCYRSGGTTFTLFFPPCE